MRFLRNNPLAVLLILYLAFQSYQSRQGSDPGSWFGSILITLPAILIGLSFHEFAHALAADRLGDRTPRMQGRVTINPGAHIDPFGLLALFFIGFGWGRPVMVDERYFKKRRRDSLIVDLAGVMTNLLLALIFLGVIKLLEYQVEFATSRLGSIVLLMLIAIVSINIALMIFNLLPIPPLDGFGIITEVFNLKEKAWYYQIYDKGMFILLIFIIFDITSRVLVPILLGILKLLTSLFHLESIYPLFIIVLFR